MSPHQVRQAAGAAFRAHQRAIAPRPIPRRIPVFRIGAGALPAGAADAMQSPLRQIAPAPSIEERLCAAAHRILSDGRTHSLEAQTWAVSFLARCAPGRELTSFIRSALRRAPGSVRVVQQLQRQHRTAA